MRSDTFAGLVTAAGCLFWAAWICLWAALITGGAVFVWRHALAA